ncbi:MAG: efflux RND transporter periplasmic adaptor subunit [Pseudomonadales bacterium]|nr:efflux RND transporter periplasmic adaptor subunit [Pseudomonadales bacterium]MBL6815172.1 efflux RND transporter periplasmic adaptor subunit [Pseudomonadales bacterium]
MRSFFFIASALIRPPLWAGMLLLIATPLSFAELTVSYVTVTPQAEFATNRVYAGTSRAARRAELGFKRGGEVATVMVDLGDSVAAGQLLAQLDTRALASDLRRAQSEEVLAAANRRSASAQTELAANTERRVRALRANGNVSQQAFDEAHLQYRASRAQLEVAQASLGRAQAAVEAMEVALSEAEIRAPFGGVIQARHVDEGSQIGPGAPALSLVETSRREAHIGIPESAVTSLTVGDAYTINWQNVSASAQLRSLLPEVNPNTRTVTAIFTVTDKRIPLGAVVELSLRQHVPGNGFWVPLEALAAMDRGLWGVFIIDAENTVQQRLVEIVHNEGDRAFVRGLLSTSDRVVATGTQRIVAGQRVIPIAAQMTISAR